MTVKKQENGKWLVQVDRTGIKRLRVTCKSEKEGQIIEREYLDKHQKKILINADKRTLIELVDIWYRYHGMNLLDGKHRRKQLIHMANDLGNPIASTMSPTQFLDYRFSRTNEGDRPITAKTFNNIHSYLNAAYRKLRKLKIIDYDCPTADIDFMPIQQRQLGYLSLDEITYLLELTRTSSNTSIYWIAQICIRTGARWGEAEKLTKKQLHNESITFEFTKSKKVRTVGLSSMFYRDLLIFCKNKFPNDRIFVNSYFTFADLLRKSDLTLPKGQKSHILRHSYASHFIMNGGNIVTLQRILGHSDIKMTMRYAHLAPDHLRDAITKGPMNALENLTSVP